MVRKTFKVPLTLEDELVCGECAGVEKGVSRDDEHDSGHDQSIPSGVGLEARAGREESLSVEALHLHGVVEANPRGRHDDPVQELRSSDKTDPPVQDLGGTGRDREV